jgi:hypothetical protein
MSKNFRGAYIIKDRLIFKNFKKFFGLGRKAPVAVEVNALLRKVNGNGMTLLLTLKGVNR